MHVYSDRFLEPFRLAPYVLEQVDSYKEEDDIFFQALQLQFLPYLVDLSNALGLDDQILEILQTKTRSRN